MKKIFKNTKLLKGKIRSKTIYLNPILYKMLPSRFHPLEIKFHNILFPFFKKNPQLFFIQIGSYDGILGDPLYGYVNRYQKSKGILIEPIKENFKKLKNNYRNRKNLFFEQVAISDSEGVQTFYSLDNNVIANSYRNEWGKRLGSLSATSILNRNWKTTDIENHIVKRNINCITFEILLKKYNIKKVDLIHIDTEGFDYKIIKTIPFNKIFPKVIIYEHKHLDESEPHCIKYLKKLGYNLIIGKHDTLAFVDF